MLLWKLLGCVPQVLYGYIAGGAWRLPAVGLAVWVTLAIVVGS